MYKKSQPNAEILPVEQDFFPLNSKELPKVLSKLKGNFETNIVFFGTPIFVVPILESLDKNFNLVAVVTGPDTIQGRKKVLTPTAVKKWVEENTNSTLIFTPEKLNDEHFRAEIESLEPDLFVVAAYGKIIPQQILDIPKFIALNIHPSLLPKYRGSTPVQSAILAGDKITGLTIIKMDAQMDHGPVVFSKKISLSQQDNNDTLHNKLFHIASVALPQLIKDFTTGKAPLKPQDHSKATFCSILKRETGYFDINNPPSNEILDRMIRAYYPWPTAWTKWDGKIIKLLPLGMIQIEGKKPIKLKEFINGYKDFPLKIV